MATCFMIVSGARRRQGDVGLDGASRTELDSHANMPVVGKHAQVLADPGETCDVSALTPDDAQMQVKLIDAAIQYDCPFNGTVSILVLKNCLHVPTMENNLIPPFVMREAGIEVNDKPKIHTINPSVEDHSLYFPEGEKRIPLSLQGVFSGFPTSKPDIRTLDEIDGNELYMLTPNSWDPHNVAYRLNEESMINWKGEIAAKSNRQQFLLSDWKEDVEMAAAMTVGSLETTVVDGNIE